MLKSQERAKAKNRNVKIMEFAIAYTSGGGECVQVRHSIDPYQELGLSPGATNNETKAAYRARARQRPRQRQVMASLAYHMITCSPSSKEYVITSSDQFALAATGYTDLLMGNFRGNLNQQDKHGRTSLYIAARSGFYDRSRALLKAGAPVNQVQRDGSTPLHGAAYYGQVRIVKLLLSSGADPTIKNRWDNTPIIETVDPDIKKLLLEYKEDKIAELAKALIKEGLATNIKSIKYNNEEIARKIIRNHEAVVSMTRQVWEERVSGWESSWHGTSFDNLRSIFTHGLVPSGQKVGGRTIKPPSGHIPLGTKCFGKANWAAAIFVSPSILYASHECYASRIMSNRLQWCVIIRARVRPGSYSEHNPTALVEKDLLPGEPDISEYRVKPYSDDKIQRVEGSGIVFVTSAVFIKTNFLETLSDSNELDYDSLRKLFERT